jgi:hypothetical protein
MKPSKLPVQSVPVERTITGMSMSNGNGIEASNFVGDVQAITVGEVIDFVTNPIGGIGDILGYFFG